MLCSLPAVSDLIQVENPEQDGGRCFTEAFCYTFMAPSSTELKSQEMPNECSFSFSLKKRAFVKHSLHPVSLQIDRRMFIWRMPFLLILLSFCRASFLSLFHFIFLLFFVSFSIISICLHFLYVLLGCVFFIKPVTFLPFLCVCPFLNSSFSSVPPVFLTTSYFSNPSHSACSFTQSPFFPTSPIRTMIRPKKRFWNTKLALASSNAPLWRRQPPLLPSPASGRNVSPPLLLQRYAFSSNKWYVCLDVFQSTRHNSWCFVHANGMKRMYVSCWNDNQLNDFLYRENRTPLHLIILKLFSFKV